MGFRFFPDRVDIESDFIEFVHIEQIAAIEDKGRFLHQIENLTIIQFLKTLLVSHDGQGMSPRHRVVRIGAIGDVAPPRQLGQDGRCPALWDRESGYAPVPPATTGRRPALESHGISGIRLECEPQQSDFLVGNCIKHGTEHIPYKSAGLKIIHPDDLFPILCYFGKAVIFTKIDQIENVFLKQEPPNPMLAFRNFVPMWLSRPAAPITSSIFASVFSHNTEMLLTDDTCYTRSALGTSLVNSLEHRFVMMIRSREIQFA